VVALSAPIGNTSLIPAAADANHGSVDAACVVTPPGGKFALARGVMFGFALPGGAAIEGLGAAAAYSLIKNQARNATEIGRFVTDRMALVLDREGAYVYEMHPKKLFVRKLLFAVPYVEIMDVRVEEGRQSLVIVTLRSTQSFRLRGPGGPNKAAEVFKLLKQRARGHLMLPQQPVIPPPPPPLSATPGPATTPTEPSRPESDPLERLERLAGLHGAGYLTDDEFAAQKAKLLADI
jgi:hypothetical protein